MPVSLNCALFEINRQIDKIAVEKPNLFSTIYLFNISMSEPRAPAIKKVERERTYVWHICSRRYQHPELDIKVIRK